jgi:V/A-type H+/Na+-transporting ATPase subunit D
MSRDNGIAPTRSNLLAGQRRLRRMTKGAELLRRKREALVAEIVRLARPAAAARALIAERAARAYPLLVKALAEEGRAGLGALAWPHRDLSLEIRPAQVWGIPVAEIVTRPPLQRTLEARGTSANMIALSAAASATEFEVLAELLLDAAPRELLLQRLGLELTRTSRQVSTLEHRMMPRLQGEVTRVRRTLEEREREEHTRLGWLIRRRR